MSLSQQLLSFATKLFSSLWFDSFGDFLSNLLLAAIAVWFLSLCREQRNVIGNAINGGANAQSKF